MKGLSSRNCFDFKLSIALASVIEVFMFLSTLDNGLLVCAQLPIQVRRPPSTKAPTRAGLPLRHLATHNNNQELLKRLFSNYIKEAVPDSYRPVIVHFDVLLLKLKQSVEKEGIFESVVALFIEWEDTRMFWDPPDFDNITLLTFDADQIWIPDIAMTNSADHLYAISRDNRFVVRVSFDGHFKYVPTGTARTWCEFTLLTFPFDFQTCTLEFESWSMNSSTMTFDWNSQLMLDSQFSSTEWSLCQYRAVTYDHLYKFTNETFTRVQFEFIVKRKSTFYVINLIFPCATLSIIQLLVFWISSTDTTVDRIGFGTTNLLTLVVFQTIVTAEMPKTSDAVTALSKYIIALITISTLGIFESVIVERMLSTELRPPPKLLLRLLRFVPVLWREKPDLLKVKQVSIDAPPSSPLGHDCNSRVLTGDPYMTSPRSTFGRRSSIMGSGFGRRSATFHGGIGMGFHVSIDSLAEEDSSSSTVDENGDREPASPTHLHAPTTPSPRPSALANGGLQRQRTLHKSLGEFPRTVSFDLENLARHHYYCNDKPDPHYPPHHPRYHPHNGVDANGKCGVSPKSSTDSCGDHQHHHHVPKSSPDTPLENTSTLEARNALMWTEVAYRIDFITFVSCASLAIGIPMSLFLPLAFVNENCADSAKGFNLE